MKFFFSTATFITGQTIVLSAEESQHAIKVLRCQANEQIFILNGKGQSASGKITDPDAKKCEVLILEVKEQHDTPYKIHIALANLKKRDRVEWFAEKAVELGIHKISIFSSERTEKKGIDKQRLEKIALSALKQSGNLWLPEISTNLTLSQILQSQTSEKKYIAHCLTDEKQLFKYQYHKNDDVAILIGPEGDFTDKEIKSAMANGFLPLNLGPLRLRSETAAFAAALTVHILNQ